MLRRSLIIVPLLILFSATVARAELQAGAAKASITPTSWPVPLIGSFNAREATKAWDPLYARAIVLTDGETEIAIVVIDLCYASREVMDEAKKRASTATGIPTNRMLVSATHTHSAPPGRDRREVKADAEYLEVVKSGIATAIEEAHKKLEPAELGFAVARVEDEVFNRRWHMKPGGIAANPFGGTNDIVRMNPPRGSEYLDRPAGPTDPDVSILSIRGKDGAMIGLLANYSLHYVGGIAPGGVSADYFGEYARLVEEKLGSDEAPMVAIMSNGTSGDINNINFRERSPRKKPFEQMRAVAGKVASATFEAIADIDYQSNLDIAMQQRELVLDKRRPNAAQLERARQVLATEDESNLPPRAKPYARWTVKLSEPPFTDPIIVQAIRIGDIAIAASPCETFVEIGLEIKEKSPLKKCFTMELANGHSGYLPTPEQHKLGGYETWLGTNTLEFEASTKITKAILEMMQENQAR